MKKKTNNTPPASQDRADKAELGEERRKRIEGTLRMENFWRAIDERSR